ncbi:sds21, partial [Symbiodinium pilosum]
MAAAADSVEITVLSLGGGEVTKLIASQETTVKELKEQISATASLPAFLLSLTFEETELEEAHTCGKLGWTGAVSIYMVVKSVDLDGHIASLRHTEEYLPAEDLRTICSLAQ